MNSTKQLITFPLKLHINTRVKMLSNGGERNVWTEGRVEMYSKQISIKLAV